VDRPAAAVISFRLGGTDGVSVEAAKWAGALGHLGFDVRTVAGAGSADAILPGLAIDAPEAPADGEIDEALVGADLVVVENLCSLPLNPGAAAGVARVLAGRRAVLHHHDLPWQRDRFAGAPAPPDDAQWIQVTINDLSRRQLAERGIAARVVMNSFDVDGAGGDRKRTREKLGLADGDRLLLQPTRAIARKNVAGGLAVAAGIGATYWLLGPAEDGYGPELEELLAGARCPVIHGAGPGGAGAGADVRDAYAGCDAVTLPSTWEGFGNPAIESAVEKRPLAIGSYPVAGELRSFGFRWFDSDDPAPLGRFLDAPDPSLLAHNYEVARRYFSVAELPERLARLFAEAGWTSWDG
jgi:glycosyltransferase involved in cell wall biosynthesis